MQLELIDWLIIATFLIVSLAIGLRYSKKASGSLTDFFLGGRNLPWYIAGISMIATTFAADTPLAVTEMVAKEGISSNWLWWSFLIGGMLTTFFFANLWRRAEVMTELELIEFRYGGKPATWLRGFKALYLGLFMNCMIIGWVNLALNSLLTTIFGIPEDVVLWWTVGFMTVAVIYSSLSGLLGVAITDTVQFFIAMIGCIVLAILVLNSSEVGGIEQLKATLPESYFNFFPEVSNEDESASVASTLTLSVGAFLSFVAVQWWAAWYPGAEPGGGGYVAQRFMSTKNEKDAVFSTLLFQVGHYCLRPWPWIVVALCAVALYNPAYNGSDAAVFAQINGLKSEMTDEQFDQHLQHSAALQAATAADPDLREAIMGGVKSVEHLTLVLPELAEPLANDKQFRQSVSYNYNTRLGYIYAMTDFLPPGLMGLLLVAFLAAYLSTISTQLNWGASYLVNDFWMLIQQKKPEEDEAAYQRKLVNVSRLVTVAVMLISVGVTSQLTSISGVWKFIMQCGAGLGLVLILRWYWWRINAWSEISATIAPFLGYAIAVWGIAPQLSEMEQATWTRNNGDFIFTVGFTTVVWLAVTFLTPAEPKAVLQRFYDRVRPGGAWKPFVSANQVAGESRKRILMLVVCWLSAITMTYSILFGIGKLIFLEWAGGLGWLGIAAVSLVVLLRCMKYSSILSK